MFKRIAVICLIGILSACSEQPPQQITEENIIIESEKTAPENFKDIAVDGIYNDYYAQKAENEELFQELWNMFRMKGESPVVDFANHDTYFISFYESSSCPKEPKNVEIEGSTLFFSLEMAGGGTQDCTADESQRTLIIEMDSYDVNHLMIREGEAETEVPLE